MKLKKIPVFALLLVCAALILGGCKTEIETTATPRIFYTVKFNSNGGTAIEQVTVAAGSKISEPPLPMLDNYVFDKWVHNGTEWSFSWNTVNANITLNAVWRDAKSVFEYSVNDDEKTVTLNKYTGDFASINLPEVINNYKISALGNELFKNLVKQDDTNYRINVPAGITEIGEYVFEDLKDVKVNIAGGLTLIGKGAFKGCDGISEINFGEGLKTIPFESFAECTAITSLSFPESLETIEENAFYGCSGLVDIVAHKSLKTIEDSAFEDCVKLKEIYFTGSEAEFEEIETATNGNEYFISAEVYYYSESKPENGNNFWYYDGNGKIKFW